MNRTIPKAKPTEFNGVTYRSKSEAIFAVALSELANVLYVYEPELPRFSFKPDFMLIASSDRFWGLIVEYKPSKPSKQYINKCVEEYKDFKKAGFFWESQVVEDFLIVFGSPFEDCILEQISIEEMIGNNPCSLSEHLQPLFEQAKNYRFDLE